SPHGEAARIDWVRLRELHEDRRAVPAEPKSPGSVAMVSVGDPMHGVELAILGERGEHLPERRVGEVAGRSPYMLLEYHGRPDLTAAAVRDGWFRSGDLGYLADGHLYVCGRTNDLIIVGGRNVYPEDLESIADAVAGIQPGRSVAFGIDDERTGSERIVMVCEAPGVDDEERRSALGQELRRRVVQELDVALGDVRVVARGW